MLIIVTVTVLYSLLTKNIAILSPSLITATKLHGLLLVFKTFLFCNL